LKLLRVTAGAAQKEPVQIAPVIRANVDSQIEIVPADGIRLPFISVAETSERRLFLAASQSRQSA
jgi:hypothetical protein